MTVAIWLQLGELAVKRPVAYLQKRAVLKLLLQSMGEQHETWGDGRMSNAKPAHSRQTRLAKGAALLIALGMAGGLAVTAQPAFRSSANLLDELRACRAIAAEGERARCYDGSVGALLGAIEAGDVRMVDREEVRKTRRQLFGLTLPETELLKPDEKDKEELTSDLFETTIASGRQTGPTSWRFTTAEGAVWEINNPPRKLAPINPGDKVVFKKASLGYYFIRINGQIGVKGRRVQ